MTTYDKYLIAGPRKLDPRSAVEKSENHIFITMQDPQLEGNGDHHEAP